MRSPPTSRVDAWYRASDLKEIDIRYDAQSWFAFMSLQSEHNHVAMRLFVDLIGWANHKIGEEVRLCVQPEVLSRCLALGQEKCLTEGQGECYLHRGMCVDNKTNCPKVPIGMQRDENGDRTKSIMPITISPWRARLDVILEPGTRFPERRFLFDDRNRRANIKLYTIRERNAIKYVVVTFNWFDGRSALDLKHTYSNTLTEGGGGVGEASEYLHESELILKRPMECYSAVTTRKIMDDAGGAVERDELMVWLKSVLANHPNARVVLCGHSLGAALAQAAMVTLSLSDAMSAELARVHAVTTGGAYVLTRTGVQLIKNRFGNNAHNVIDFCSNVDFGNRIKDGYTSLNYWLKDAIGVPLDRLNSFLIDGSGNVEHHSEELAKPFDRDFLHDLGFYVDLMMKYMKAFESHGTA